jgi:hypothetical protein
MAALNNETPIVSSGPSSLDNKYSRYVQGGSTSTNYIGLDWWERRLIPKHETDIIYFVENQYVHRLPDIASAFYGDTRYWWVIAQVNDILDPHTEIFAGRRLVIPTKSRLFTEILI